MRIILLLLPVFISSSLLAQSAIIDSIRREIRVASDSAKIVEMEVSLAYHFSVVNRDSALKYANLGISNSKAIGDSIQLAFAYQHLAQALIRFPEGQFSDSIIPYIDSSGAIAERINFAKGITKYYLLKGYYYYQTDNYEKAIDNFLIVETRFREEGDSAGVASMIYNNAVLYNKAQEYDKAIALVKDNMAALKRSGDSRLYHVVLEFLGNTYSENNEADSSLKYKKIAYHLFMDGGNITDKIRITSNLAGAYNKMGEQDSAIYYFNQAQKLAEFPGGEKHLLGVYFFHATLFEENGDFDSAEEYYLQSLEIAGNNLDNETLLTIYDRLSSHYEKRGLYDKALTNLRRYSALRDSLSVAGIDDLLEKAKSERDLKEKEIELERLSEISIAQIRWIEIGVVYSILAFVFFISLWIIFSISSVKQRDLLLKFENSVPGIDQLKYPISGRALSWKMIAGLSALYLLLNSVLFFEPGFHRGYINLFLFLLVSTAVFWLGQQFILNNSTRWHIDKVRSKLVLYLLFYLVNVSVLYFLGRGLEIQQELSADNFIPTWVAAGNLAVVLCLEIFILYRWKVSVFQDQVVKVLNDRMEWLKKRKEARASDTEKSNGVVEFENAGRKIALMPDAIIYIASDNIYQEVVCEEKGRLNKILLRCTLSDVEKRLGNLPQFQRCHRSYIVNTERVKALEGRGRQRYFILGPENNEVPIARSFESQIINSMEALFSK